MRHLGTSFCLKNELDRSAGNFVFDLSVGFDVVVIPRPVTFDVLTAIVLSYAQFDDQWQLFAGSAGVPPATRRRRAVF